MRITKNTVEKLFDLYNSKHLKTRYDRTLIYNLYKIALYEMDITKKQIRDCRWRLLFDDKHIMNWNDHNAELYVITNNGYVRFYLNINSKGIFIVKDIEL